MNDSKMSKVELVQRTYEALNELYERSHKAGIETVCSEGRYHPEISFNLVLKLKDARDYFGNILQSIERRQAGLRYVQGLGSVGTYIASQNTLEHISDVYLQAGYNDLQKALDPLWGGKLEESIHEYAALLSLDKGAKKARSEAVPMDCIAKAKSALNYFDMIKEMSLHREVL